MDGLTDDELEALSLATALVVIGLQETKKDSEADFSLAVFDGRDLISAYLEVHMEIDRDVSQVIATNLLAGLIEKGDL
jgi:hypothetical protein